MNTLAGTAVRNADSESTRFRILGALSLAHFLNDMMQSLILALYPILKGQFELSFTQVGLITLTYQVTASLLQPLVGTYTDRHPQPYSLSVGMSFTLLGLLALAIAPNYPSVLLAAALVGTGSAVFHPESSRMARLASGGRHGLAQSMFQVGGNAGSATGPLLAAWVILRHGQSSISWFAPFAIAAIVLLFQVGRWYQGRRAQGPRKAAVTAPASPASGRVVFVLSILIVLMFSKFFYLASLNSYYTFYLIHRFGLSVGSAQTYLFLFLFSAAVGTLVGGPIGDRIGRKYVIWVSILGAAPFALCLPYANLFWTGVLSVCIGLILSSAFSAIVVYAQELMPGKIGMVSGLFFGFAFGMGGVGAAVLGWLIDVTSITTVYKVCAFLPLIGLVAVFLPNLRHPTVVAGTAPARA